MIITSWNVNGIRACMNKGFLDFLKSHQPDILGLQEIKGQREKVEKEIKAIEDTGYDVVWHAAERPGYSGTALLHRRDSGVVLPDMIMHEIGTEADNEGRVIMAEYPDFWFVTVYTPNSKNGLERLDYRYDDWDKVFLSKMKDLEKTKPVIYCGDLNVAHKEIDLKNPKPNRTTATKPGNAGFTDKERERFEDMLDAGFVDTFRHFYPEKEGMYSWWSYLGQARSRNAGWRIDYVMTSSSLVPKLRSADILMDVLGSDHCPVTLEIET